MFRDKNDRPLLAVLAVLAVVAIAAAPKGIATGPMTAEAAAAVAALPADYGAAPLTAEAAAAVAALPADYGAAPLAGTTATAIPKAGSMADIVRDPADLPPPIGARGPRRVKVNLTAVEVTGQLADGATYHYWTFNGKVPGPFVRVRVGDIVEVHFTNDANSMMMHNVDFHAVTGPGGGAKATESNPGETRGFEFKAEHAGLFVYHCAVMPAAQHIASGMYGMILVEPEGGLPKVDREFYVMQGEIYTQAAYGAQGEQQDSYDKLLDERPEYYVFNGAVGALSTRHPLHAKVGETVRVFFGVGGPNKTSSFHVIGEVMDRVYNMGSLTSPPARDVQTVSVPPGSATAAEFKVDVPGKYMMVDHALSRVERGLSGVLQVEGPQQDASLYKDYDPKRSAMVMGH